MADRLLPTDLVFEGSFPRLSRRLRIGIVGGGRIAVTQAMAARLSDRWEVVAGALSSDPRLSKTRGVQWYLPEDGEPDRVLSRGQGGGIDPGVERFVRLARGFSEGMIEAWGNLYMEFAMAVAARRDGVTPPADWLNYPTVEQGAQGVRFIDAAVESNKAGGAWVDCRLKL